MAVDGSEQTSKEILTLTGHLGRNVRAVSACGRMLATGGEDAGIKVWNLQNMV